jgi:hypothetical protein
MRLPNGTRMATKYIGSREGRKILGNLPQGTGKLGRETLAAINYGYSSGGNQTRLNLPV